MGHLDFEVFCTLPPSVGTIGFFCCCPRWKRRVNCKLQKRHYYASHNIFQRSVNRFSFPHRVQKLIMLRHRDRISSLVKKMHDILQHLHWRTFLHTVYRCLIPDYAVCRAATTISRAPNKFRMYA